MSATVSDRGDVGFNRDQGVLVVFIARQREQFGSVVQLRTNAGEPGDDAVQQLFLAPQGLGALGVLPDVRVFEFAGDFDYACLLGIEVKDTSAVPALARQDLRGNWRWR